MGDLRTRLGALSGDQRAELRARLAATRRDAPPPPRTGPVPASFAQRTLWFLDRLAPGNAGYHTGVTYTLTGPLDVPALRRALARVVERHESLRTEFTETADGPLQRVLSDVEVALPETAVADREEAGRIALDETRRPFDLSRGPLWRARLLRIGAEEHVLVLVAHHIVVDGWSFEVLTADLSAYYRAESGLPAELPRPLPLQYADHSEAQRAELTGPAGAELAAHWRERLAGLPVVELPADRPRPARMTYAGARHERMLPRSLVDATAELVRTERVTPFAVYLTAFAALLHRYTGLTDLVVGSPAAGRTRLETEPLVGFFATMLPLRLDVGGDPTGRELLGRVVDSVRDAFAHGELPFELIVDAVRPRRDPSRSPLFQIGFTAEEGSPPPELPGVTVERAYVDAGSSRFDLSWWVTAVPDGLHLSIEYNSDLYDAATVSQLADHYDRMLTGLLADPGQAVSTVPLLSPSDRHDMLVRWNGPALPVPRTSVVASFEAQVRRAPGAVALVVGGTELTYAELDRRATELAALLRGRGAGPGRLVALCLGRRADLIVAVLAVLRSGAAYVPIDPTNPPARVRVILEDADPVCVLTHRALAGRLPDDGTDVVVLDEPWPATVSVPPGPEPGPTDLAYVMYTSGTTGRPKGVAVEHHSVIGFVAAMTELFHLTPADRVLGYASPTFDVFVGEVFMALLNGGRLCLAEDDDRLSMSRLQRLMEDTAVTVTDLPPAVMALLRPERFPALRIVFAGGELFPGELVNRWNPGRHFFNGYGPTECTVTMVVHECPGRWDGPPPIGLPIANHVAHVLDRHLEPVPYGVPGELVIGGEGLARGYHNAPELTAQKFVEDPFGSTADGRLYRTGDLVSRRRDGAIAFLGRIDTQVKVRGIRIELGEVEAALATDPRVDQAAVVAWTDPRGERHLVAYVTAARGAELTPAELRAALSERLPRFMVPSYWVLLDALPLTLSGKVDRRALPEPDLSARPPREVVAARTHTERVLAGELVPRVLGVDLVGVTDDFFELGGNSLQAAALMTRVAETFGVEAALADFFAEPTVATLAGLVDRELAAVDPDVLAGIAGLSDEEAARLLEAESRD
ncbi:hypothetical protein Asp14428_21670 [Actinoplanes sp. NBRC 14428]|nr:hypothetical protein Asp14428_21670 [Actinoplanes sp. NBRC 14428]